MTRWQDHWQAVPQRLQPPRYFRKPASRSSRKMMVRSRACRGPRNFCCRCGNSPIMRKSASSMSRPTAAACRARSRCCFEPATGSKCRFRSALQHWQSARNPRSEPDRLVLGELIIPTDVDHALPIAFYGSAPYHSYRKCRLGAFRRDCAGRHSKSNCRCRSDRHRRRRFFPDAVRPGNAGCGSHFDGDHAFDDRRRNVAGPVACVSPTA